MFCQNCGTPLNDGAKFCEKCGMAVSTTELSPLPSQPSTQTEPPLEAASSVPPPVKQKHIRRNALIAVGVAVAAIVLVVRDRLLRDSSFNHFVDRGWEYTYNKNYDEAIKAYSEALRIRLDAEIYSRRAMTYRIVGDRNSAIADLNQAIILEPNSAEYYNYRGKIYYEKGDFDRAVADLSQAIILEPINASYYSYRSDMYYEKGDFDRAVADLNQAIMLESYSSYYYGKRGDMYFEKGDDDRAIADYTQAITILLDMLAEQWNNGDRGFDSDIAKYFNKRGMAYYSKGNYSSATADFSQAVKFDPDKEVYNENLEIMKTLK